MTLLDTNAAIGIINGDTKILERLRTALRGGDDVAISSIVLSELVYGAEHGSRRDHGLQRLDTFLAGPVSVVDFDAEDAVESGRVREELARVGRPIGPYDVLIAAQARRRGATLITANEREFRRVRGLKSENWARR
jgi:tRNA(fMet)-specific endonuclease VapC